MGRDNIVVGTKVVCYRHSYDNVGVLCPVERVLKTCFEANGKKWLFDGRARGKGSCGRWELYTCDVHARRAIAIKSRRVADKLSELNQAVYHTSNKCRQWSGSVPSSDEVESLVELVGELKELVADD